MADGIGSLLGSGAQVRDAITRLGGQAGITDAYLAAMMGIIGLAAAGYAVSAVLRLRPRRPRSAPSRYWPPPGRDGWGASHLIVAAAGSAVVLAAAGCRGRAGLGLRVGDVGGQLPRLLGAAIAQLPAALVVAAVAVAAVRAAAAVLRGRRLDGAGRAAAVVLLGPTLRLGQWVQDISPFTHVPRLPGGPVSALPLAWLAVIALALAAAGLAGLRCRDIG